MENAELSPETYLQLNDGLAYSWAYVVVLKERRKTMKQELDLTEKSTVPLIRRLQQADELRSSSIVMEVFLTGYGCCLTEFERLTGVTFWIHIKTML